ncbi:hypothetical protein QQF64_004946 [Cirrhinus molitorella]|uniref:Uncharacterized protein n=1 Tax=Cirrhinus molitorella TaxID=172907 RepID=A0ABR3MHQ2_9TELE
MERGSAEESALEIATTQAKGQSRIFYLLITLSGPVHRNGVNPSSSSPARKPRGFSPCHVKTRGGRLLEKAIKSPSKEQY